jgi:hypothetical protein
MPKQTKNPKTTAKKPPKQKQINTYSLPDLEECSVIATFIYASILILISCHSPQGQ